MSWHYRVIRHPDGSLALHEVYCDDAGRPNGCTQQPVGFVANEDEGLSGLVEALEMALRDARERPILDMAAFGTKP